MDIPLTGHHRTTAERILAHPASHNVAWHDVVSLLSQIGTVTEEDNERFKVTVVDNPRPLMHRKAKYVDQQIVDLRRMLRNVGITAESLKR